MINCFIPYQEEASAIQTIASLRAVSLVNDIYLLYTKKIPQIEGCKLMQVDNLQSSATVQQIVAQATSDYTIIYTKHTPLELGQYAVERFLQVAQDTGAGLLYTDFYQLINGERKALPTIDYQIGSVRDDFNFGSVLFYSSKALKQAADLMKESYQFAGLYDLRLKISEQHPIFHLNEYLYTEMEDDTRKSGEKQFDYVDPKNRTVQLEMEAVCTNHLKAIGAYMKPMFKKVIFDEHNFPVEASVIIPVKNRVKTIADAIQSTLCQETTFAFNIIIIDNFSDDGTTQLIATFAKQDKRIIHIIPNRKDLGIGGCWNEGVQHALCGKFAVQLDSDDVYASENTLQIIVDTFYNENCAMVIGAYTMTDFAMQTIPPGLIDHKEWTPENGRNNALRINGLGAPRAFYTPLLRQFKVPNTSYGEDYALGLRFSREYQIGRVYQSVYLCRRWNENSDAALDTSKINAYNHYKDTLRTLEIQARKQLVL
ncbi:MAG: glycosyltransferase family 2 protein [Paludibacteraceae bacterium]|nr:glycosyltransferase family 2 protein [Paludibacteraceae bacterium]